MAALHLISKNHKFYVSKIKYARKILLKYSLNKKNPLIGLNINKIVKNKNKFKNVIFYQPRYKKSTQLVFFLGFDSFLTVF